MVQEEIIFYGHPNVQSLHARTIEITKDEHLTLKGDCIIGIKASKACSDLNESLKRRLQNNHSIVKIEIMVGNETFSVIGSGDERLTLLNSHDIVIRKSNFVCPRTMAIRCDRASSDLPREMVELLRDDKTKGIFGVTVE